MLKLSLALSTPVYELEQCMTSSEFSEYMEYDAIAPFGNERDNIHAGLIASAVINSSMSRPKKPVMPSDFMLKTTADRQAEDEKQKVQALMAFMMGLKNG